MKIRTCFLVLVLSLDVRSEELVHLTELTVTASSVLKGSPQYSPEIVNASWDANSDVPKKIWCEGVEGPGIGEWLRIKFKKPTSVYNVAIYNGFMKHQNNEEDWYHPT